MLAVLHLLQGGITCPRLVTGTATKYQLISISSMATLCEGGHDGLAHGVGCLFTGHYGGGRLKKNGAK